MQAGTFSNNSLISNNVVVFILSPTNISEKNKKQKQNYILPDADTDLLLSITDA